MGTGDDARNAEVEAILAGGQAAINRYLILGVMDIRANCAARKCDTNGRSFVQWGKFRFQEWGIVAFVIVAVLSALITVAARLVGG